MRRALVATGFPYEKELLPRALGQFAAFAQRSQAVRRIGSAALDLAYVAAGRFDSYWKASIRAWDIAAGILLVEEAGGTVTDIVGQPLTLMPRTSVLSSNGLLHGAMLETLSESRPLTVD